MKAVSGARRRGVSVAFSGGARQRGVSVALSSGYAAARGVRCVKRRYASVRCILFYWLDPN